MYDVKEIRKQFPMLNNKKMQGHDLVYLDNASTTFKPQCVIDAMNKYYMEVTSNSHRGDYDLMNANDTLIIETRKTVAHFVNCEPNEVVFTSGDTESINLLANAYAKRVLKKGDVIVLSESEHASNLLPWFEVAHETGALIEYVSLDEKGRITIDNLEKIMSDKVKIVALAHTSNVLGYTIDIKEFAKVVHSYGALFAVDGAQSVPHTKVDFKDSDIDFLSFSGHKMCAPTGIGCLIGKYELLQNMSLYKVGGGMNVSFDKETSLVPYEAPMKFEAGTLNISGIYGLKAAIEFLESIGIENIHKHDQELCEYAISEMEKIDDIIIYNKDAQNGIVTFNKKGIFAQDEATLFNSKGIAIRSGQHCAKILKDYLGCIATCRMSTYLYTTKEDIDAFLDVLRNGGDILDAYFN